MTWRSPTTFSYAILQLKQKTVRRHYRHVWGPTVGQKGMGQHHQFVNTLILILLSPTLTPYNLFSSYDTPTPEHIWRDWEKERYTWGTLWAAVGPERIRYRSDVIKTQWVTYVVTDTDWCMNWGADGGSRVATQLVVCNPSLNHCQTIATRSTYRFQLNSFLIHNYWVQPSKWMPGSTRHLVDQPSCRA